jgi:hypothetical protein
MGGGVMAAVVVATLAVGVYAQYPEGGGLYNQALGQLAATLDVQLQNHPDLEDIYYPMKYAIPIDYYRIEPSVGYTQNVIFDPCRGHGFDCCKDVYGQPEFNVQVGDDEILLKDSGRVMEFQTRCVACRGARMCASA